MLREHDLGVGVDNGEGEALLDGLRKIAAAPQRWQRMSTLARQLAETRFDRPLAMAKHVEVLEAVLRERR